MSEDSRKKLFIGGQGMQQDFDVFNSLLARGRGQNVRDRNKALFLTGLTAIFQGKQKKLQQKLLDNLANLDETFQTEQESRRTIYNKENENRAFYDKYVANPSQGIEDYAKFLYNNDEAISQAGVQFANKAFYKGDTQELVDDLWSSLRKRAKSELDQMGTNPLITSRTFQEYDKAYYDTYKAEKRQLKDDPTQSSLLKAAANKIFPSWFDDRKADLQLAVEEGNRVIDTQEQNEKFGSLAAADYLAGQQKFDKKQAKNEISARYGDILDVDELGIVMKNIDNRVENKMFSEDELISLAVSTRILNPNNESKLASEIRQAKEFFESKYLFDNKLARLPEVGTDEYTDFIERQQDYVSDTVFNQDPASIKETKKYLAILADPDADPEIKKIAKIWVANNNRSDILTTFIADRALYFIDPANKQTIDTRIKNEKDSAKVENREPRFTDPISLLAFEELEARIILGETQ